MPEPVTASIVAIFALVACGMFLGEPPFLQPDRTGVALLGAIAIAGAEAPVTPATRAITAAWFALRV